MRPNRSSNFLLWRALVLKDLRVFLSNKGVAFMTITYTPLFIFAFGVFIYPYLVPPQDLPQVYQYGLLFVTAYPILINTYMGMGQNIVLDTLQGVMLRLATLPVDHRIEVMARMSAYFITVLWTICSGWIALVAAAYIKHVTPVPSPLGFPWPVYVSLIPFYLTSTGIALMVAALVRGRIQLYNLIAVSMINVVPFLSGMFIPLFMLPKVLQFIDRFNPFAIPFLLATNTTNAYGVNGTEELLISSIIGVIMFGVGLYFYEKAFRKHSGMR